MEFGMQACCDLLAIKEEEPVVRPRVIWSICEDDIVAMARERGIELTEEQLDATAKYVKKSLDAVCNWFMVVDMALNEAVQPAETVVNVVNNNR
ncbi:MAG: hypothetical protein DRI40_06415 [Chloroflexi bacterium]|nr:MAG: hypothetical protein DRI40_06415 [Chloroflexota bacterium]